jgi:hypothetical protein
MSIDLISRKHIIDPFLMFTDRAANFGLRAGGDQTLYTTRKQPPWLELLENDAGVLP